MDRPRRLIVASLLLAALAVIPVDARGGAEARAPPGGDAITSPATAAPRIFHESPMLAASQDLPALEKRLPKEPLVVTPVGGAGRYGGLWRQARTEADLPSLWTSLVRSRIVGLGTDLTTVEPELIASYEVSSDRRVYTLHLREGLRWSDGEKCDSDDFLFAYEDVLLDPDLTPAKPAELMAGGLMARFEKVDGKTVRYTFATPNALFLRSCAQPRVVLDLVLPKHYLKKFHIRYAKKADLEELQTAGGFESWVDLFAAKSRPERNAEIPALDAWVRVPGEEEGTLRLERNPYFWQVDPDGNQLPYLDGIEVALCVDAAAVAARMAAGEVDLDISAAGPEAPAGFHLVDVEPMHANVHTVFLNRAADDPAKAALLGDLRFREALSIAIDREAISRGVHRDRGVPSQVAPPPGDAAYDERTAKLYTGLDVDRANELLDEIGLPWDAKHERRLGAEGKALELSVAYPLSWPPGQEEAVALMRDGWAAIGVSILQRPMERGAWIELMRGGDWDLAVYAANTGGGAYLYVSSDGVFPLDSYWFPAALWGQWFLTRGSRGKEPPVEVKKLHDLYEEYLAAPAGEGATRIERDAFDLYVSNLLAIGVLSRPPGELVALASDRMRGLPEAPLVDDLSLYRPASLWLAAED